MKRIKKFFKDMFGNVLGIPYKKTKKTRLKWLLYWVVGLLLAFLIPTLFLYLESWQFTWNIAEIIYPEGGNYVGRHSYYWIGVISIILFVIVGYLNPGNIGQDRNLLGAKIILRMFMVIAASASIIAYIASIIVY